jgi:FAD/FMN-containing dehydrogenase
MTQGLPSKPAVEWQNWSGSQRQRAQLLTPSDRGEVARIVREARAAGRTVRCVGSAHSFVPFWTDDVILSLDALGGLIDVDRERCLATVAAGTKLHQLGPLLWQHGLSLPQQGDIDRQSVAGALSTGTHGTGRTLPSLPNFIRAMTLVTGEGEVRRLTPEADGELFAAAQVAQGALGVMIDVTLALDPAFNLHERTWSCPFVECEATHPALIDANRHFEFFWAANTDACEMKVLNKTDMEPATLGEREYVAPAYRAFPTDRDIRFNEMEYSVPFASGWDCFLELRQMMLRDFPNCPGRSSTAHWPPTTSC